uniref:Uncharacterized protein n=1 Tax=Arundo donax TaxID=35708 RepID=A0A0A8ZNM0_ARUDO
MHGKYGISLKSRIHWYGCASLCIYKCVCNLL